MRLLVTGGAGFIGSNFVRYVAKATGYELLVYDKLTYAGRLENIADLVREGRVGFVRGDIADEESFKRVVSEYQPDAVVNFAAETHVDRSINEPAPFIRTNVLGVFTVLETLRRQGGDTLLFHVSTDEVYGDLYGSSAEAGEDYPLNPSSPYSASKASGDLLIKAYARTYGLEYIIVRPCNNYGPYQHPEKLVPRTIIRLLHGKPAVIYGDGGQVRDWIHVEDTSRALLLLLEKAPKGQVYNVCRGNYATVREVVERLVRYMGFDPSEKVVYAKRRPGEDMRYAMRCDKLRELGWRPVYDLETGLRETVKWYLGNEWWWRPLVEEAYVLADTPW
ncbi:dTDP-glucose 4,6-dehydratase [Thermogladius calderae 1633]|uniref:dTDP-glucose 4,6-dehydratase n=1 Tax=Thermogladius calderae (strain DSM 22663 / VKM B-2946 / 1633) TaxID=1184251 RepID=I3TCW6_THEC1|nr:dTDP-glucose 4,6-dehydratase [Thermogladius calderae]AFK50604.1 dTDP-glucose 4,6-dehydratase [Thermogladius calderae 1633]